MKAAQLLQEYIEVGIIDVRDVRRAAGRLDVVTGRVREAKEVMQDGPHVPIAVARLALADVEDDHPRESAFLFGRLHREREPGNHV